jgi:hypothetical protein
MLPRQPAALPDISLPKAAPPAHERSCLPHVSWTPLPVYRVRHDRGQAPAVCLVVEAPGSSVLTVPKRIPPFRLDPQPLTPDAEAAAGVVHVFVCFDCFDAPARLAST